MNKSLYHINNEYLQLIEQLEYDEATPEALQALAINEAEAAAKVGSCIYVLDNSSQAVEMAKIIKKRAEDIIKAEEKKQERVKELLENLVVLRGGSFTTGVHTVSLRRSDMVIINKAEQLPAEYLTRKVVETPDKAKIKLALKAGQDVPGAELITNQNLQIK